MASFLRKIFSPKQEEVPSDQTIGQILDVVSGGAYPYLNSFSIGSFGDMRNASMNFPAYLRVITLLSGVMSELITNGSLRIYDKEGNLVKTQKARKILNLFEHTPDGETPAQTWVEDWCVDYLVDGNALCEVNKVSNRIVGLNRLSVWDANTVEGTNGNITYRVRKIGHTLTNEFVDVASMNVMHSRWPRVLRYSASSTANRWNFAAPPVRLMRPSLEIGLAGDQYIKEWFEGNNKSSIGISLKDKLSVKMLPDILDAIADATKKGSPMLVPAEATFTNLNNNAANKDQDALREFQVSDVARVYGVPGPILGQQVTQWGQGIEQLAKLFWKVCIRQHLIRMLEPAKFRLLEPGQKFAVDPTDLLRGDITSISSLITATRRDAQTDQIATIGEQRKWLGLPNKPESGEELLKATGEDSNMNGNFNE